MNRLAAWIDRWLDKDPIAIGFHVTIVVMTLVFLVFMMRVIYG